MSRLPPCSRGGTVLRHSDGFEPSTPQTVAGFACSVPGGITMPPASNNSVSRRSIFACKSLSGKVVTTPGKLPFGIRTPGNASLSAYLSFKRQTIKRPSVPNCSAANPNAPASVQPTFAGLSDSMVMARTSPALAPLIWTGPVKA